MRTKLKTKPVVYCEECGAPELSGGAEFVMFHYLAFCSPDCRDDYRTADEARREKQRPAREREPARKRVPTRVAA